MHPLIQFLVSMCMIHYPGQAELKSCVSQTMQCMNKKAAGRTELTEKEFEQILFPCVKKHSKVDPRGNIRK